jgi:hypothetical protein
MRPVQILDKPVAAPFTCLGCGAGVERQFFVDIGLDIHMEKNDEHNHNYLTHGTIYLCSECITSLIVEFNRKLTPFLKHQFIARGFQLDANSNEIRTLQNEVFMLRDRLKVVDEENQNLRYSLLSKFDQENNVLSPPAPGSPSAEDLVNQMLGADTNGDTAGSVDADVDGHDPSATGNDSGSEPDNSNTASNEPDSLTLTHLSFGSIAASDTGSS